MRIGIIILATNSYFVLGIRFIKRFMQFYAGEKEIKFFFFSDTSPEDYLPDGYDVKYIHVTNTNWVDGTNLKFTSIISLENEDITYLFYFDADTNIYKSFTEEWFLGDMVGAQHWGDQEWMINNRPFDRNLRSKAYVPKNTSLPEMYFYGAFFGGIKKRMIEFCKLMRSYQLADREWGYEPGVNDESYINREFHFHPPEKIILSKNFQFLVSDKGGIGETRRMDLNVDMIKLELKASKNFLVNIANGKVSII
jgi:hypothetical protein